MSLKFVLHILMAFCAMLLIGDFIVTKKFFVDPPRTSAPIFKDVHDKKTTDTPENKK